ncbi:fumarylacetoacetate hydrolase family protein [Alkalihalobacterium sp. APHAB7]|uniref:fumarylacetoacetate hydrolase family protein n=1 Tax=Alkalihalobacterium sp. APHAB7 TaxID=3402081 RepID=UPI003AAFBAC5
MKLVTYRHANGDLRSGWILGNGVADMQEVSKGQLPSNLLEFIKLNEEYLPLANEINRHLIEPSYNFDEVQLTTPIPIPPSVRDFMAFEEHVVNATKRSKIKMSEAWYEIPAFYFTNHLVLKGPEEDVERPPTCRMLDYELEIACIIGKDGRDIKAEEADDYIFGYTILNDWSARDLQMKEMQIGLGPAKGKDFATSIGPYIITKDELEPYRSGDKFNLRMTAKVNGKLLSEGNAQTMYYTFGQMIERASAGVPLHCGEIFGSGTVGSGCILELGNEVHRWLEPGDKVELEIEHLGTLKNKII